MHLLLLAFSVAKLICSKEST